MVYVGRLIIIITFVLIGFCHAQAQALTELSKLPDVLKGCSGIEFTNNGELYMINDHGNPFLYVIDTATFKIKRAHYLNHAMKDWEDLTTDNKGTLFIGDFGNNHNDRKDLKIYKIALPIDSSAKLTTGESIRFSLPDQKNFPPERNKFEFDIESMAYYNDSLYLFSKSRGKPFKGLVKVYRLPVTPGDHVAELIGQKEFNSGPMFENWITSADINEQGQLVLLSHGKIFLFEGVINDDFFASDYKEINLEHFSQKEAVTFVKNNMLFITDERTEGIFGGKLYKFVIPE